MDVRAARLTGLFSGMECGYYDAGRCRSCTLLPVPYVDQLAGKAARVR